MPWLTLLVFLPCVFALIVALQSKQNLKAIQSLTLFGTIITAILSLVVASAYAYAPAYLTQFRLEDKLVWIKALHVNYYLGMDGISLAMVLMTTLIWPFVVGVSFKEINERAREYYCWVLLMETAVLGVFLSLNLVLYYIFWEAMLIPAYFLIGIWGGPKRVYATVKFFLYTMVGSMVMLVSIMALYFQSGQTTLDFPVLQQMVGTGALVFHGATETLLFIGFFLAFGIKSPIWPFHTWVPDAYSQAPTGGTIILVALKMGLYGFIRFCLPLFPNAVRDCAPWIIALSVIGIIYAALVAAMQTDLKRLIAYSSISHIGVIMLAIFSMTSIGITGAVVQMVSHTFTTGALFIILGLLYARRKSYEIADYGGLMGVMPAFTAVFLIATLSSVALPLTSGFTGEFLMLVGSFQTHPWATGFATTAAVWSVVYMLWMFQRVMYGPITNDENKGLKDLQWPEWAALTPLVAVIFFLGIYPTPFLKMLNPSVSTVIAQARPAYVDPFAHPTPNATSTVTKTALVPQPSLLRLGAPDTKHPVKNAVKIAER
jgi:NADH-quinone oxidoreductase subunit M